MDPNEPNVTATNRAARAQALFDAVLRTRADVPDGVRIHCAAAVNVLGRPFPEVAAVRDSTDDPVFTLEPAGADVEAALRAGLHELGLLPPAKFREVFPAAEAGHDALSALR